MTIARSVYQFTRNTIAAFIVVAALFATAFTLAPANAQDDPHNRYGYDGACTLFVGASGVQTSYALYRANHNPDWVGGWVEPGEPDVYFAVFDGEPFLLEITVVKPRNGGTAHHRIIEGIGTCPDTTTTASTTSVIPSSTTSTTTTTTTSFGSTTTVAPVTTTLVPSGSTTTTLLPQPTMVDCPGPFASPRPEGCPPVSDIVWPPVGFTDTGYVDDQGAPVLLWSGEESG